MTASQVTAGAVVLFAGAGFLVHGRQRLIQAKTASGEPLDNWLEHQLNFGLLPRSFGSRRRVEYLAALGEIIGGVFAFVAGVAILASGLGG